MLVGIHVEGNDWLIVRTLLARLLDRDEATIEVDRIDHPGMGWQAVIEQAPKTLKRFYAKFCALAVLGVDNDGNLDALAEGAAEDPRHPRHWRHEDRVDACRYCALYEVAEFTRRALTWIPTQPGATWPVCICVPVEIIESWLLAALAIASPGHGSLHAENEWRSGQKQAFYGRPEATREDVEVIALPLLRRLSAEQLQQLRGHSRSFDLFAEQALASQS